MASCYMYTGDVLRKGQELVALNGDYNFIHQYDGNVVIYSKGTTSVWESGTSGKETSVVTLQEDGNLVLLDTDNNEIWSSDTKDSGSTVLILQDNGDAALWDADHKFVKNWGAGVKSDSGLFDHTKIPIAGVLPLSGSLFTPNRESVLQLSTNGDVVIKNSAGKFKGMGIRGGKYLVMQNDGNLVMYGDSSTALWSSNTVGSGARAVMLLTNSKLVLVDDEKTSLDNAADHTIQEIVDANDL